MICWTQFFNTCLTCANKGPSYMSIAGLGRPALRIRPLTHVGHTLLLGTLNIIKMSDLKYPNHVSRHHKVNIGQERNRDAYLKVSMSKDRTRDAYQRGSTM